MTTQTMGFNVNAVQDVVTTTAEPMLREMMERPAPGIRDIFAKDENTPTFRKQFNTSGPTPRLKPWIAGVPIEVLRHYSLTEEVYPLRAALGIHEYEFEGGSVTVKERVASFLSGNANYLDEVAMSALWGAAGFGKVGYDGMPLFSAAHPHGPGGGTQGNVTANAPTYANLEAAHVAMTLLRRENGETFGVDPDTIMCGPSLRFVFERLVGARAQIRAAALNNLGAEAATSVVTAAGISNIHAGRYNVIVNHRMIGDFANHWYLIDSKVADKAVVVGGFKSNGIRFVPRNQISDEPWIENQEFHYLLHADVYNAAYAWQGISLHGASGL